MLSVLSLLFTISLVFSEEEQQCLRGSARVAFRDGDLESYKVRGRYETCPGSDWGCGGVRKFARSILVDRDDEDTDASGYSSRSWTGLDLGCVPPAICEKVIGDSTGIGCRYVDYSWIRYDPISCNASADPPYDADKYRQKVRMYYACCDTNNCIDPEDATQTNRRLNNTCTENTALGTYITGLHKCWKSARWQYRKYFVCDTEGPDLVEFREVCMDDVYNEWSRDRAGNQSNMTEICFYRPTCTTELKELIAGFGECACQKAQRFGYSGGGIGHLMESIWSDFCPGLQISCAGKNGTLWLRHRKRRRKIRFRIANALATFTDAVKTEFRQKIAAYLRRIDSEDDITVTVTEATSGTRRLLADSSDVEIAIDGSDEFDDGIDTAACDQSGIASAFPTAVNGQITDFTCDSGDVFETVAGMNFTEEGTTQEPDTDTTSVGGVGEDDGNVGLYVIFAVMIGLVGYLME